MFKKFDGLLGESVYKYMIFVIFKLENDENELGKMMCEVFEIVKLNVKCNSRYVIFGDDLKNIFFECVRQFDDIFIKLIKENEW